MRRFICNAMIAAIYGSLVAACALNSAIAAEISETEMAGLAQTELQTALRQRYPDVTEWSVAPVVGSTHLSPPSDDAALRTEVLNTGARSAVRVSWRQSDRSQRSRTFWFDVVGKRSVFVAVRDFTARQEVFAADVESSERDVLQIRCTLIRSPDEVAGMRTTRALRSGAPICKESIEIEPPVARGDNVTVYYESEKVSLTSKGVAQQDGRLGETLRVLNPATRDSFVAIVSGNHEVMVHE